MAEILSMGNYPEEKIPRQNPLKLIVEKFNLLDRYLKFSIVGLVLLMLVIPFTKGLIFDTRQRASETPTGSQVLVNNNQIEKWAMPQTKGADYKNYFNDTNSWNELFNNIDVFKTHIQVAAQNSNLNYFLRIKPFFESHPNVKFALEASGPMLPGDADVPGGGVNHPGVDCQNNGSTSAALELSWIKNVYDSGMKVDYITLDDPLRKIAKGGPTTGCQLPINKAIDELIIYMKTVHATYPDIKFGYIPNFPNWQWKRQPAYWGQDNPNYQVGDFDVIFPLMLEKLTAVGEKLYFVHADQTYDYLLGIAPSYPGVDTKKYNWLQRVKELQSLVESKGLPFGILYNSEIGTRTSNDLASADVQAYITLYRQTGKSMQHFIIETWDDYPNNILSFLNEYKRGLQVNSIPGVSTQQPVYRLFKNPFHLYTTSETEKNTLIASGYTYEGVAFNTYVNNIYGVTPLFRIKVNTTNSWFYTTSEEEKATVLKTGQYTDSGDVGRCYKEPMQPSSATALYRAFNASTGDFLYTTNHNEFSDAINKYGYVPQKVECFVPSYDYSSNTFSTPTPTPTPACKTLNMLCGGLNPNANACCPGLVCKTTSTTPDAQGTCVSATVTPKPTVLPTPTLKPTPTPIPGKITFVRNIGSVSISKSGNTTASITVSSSGVAGGHKVIVASQVGTFAGAVSCKDSKGNVYTINGRSATNNLILCSANITTSLVSGDKITVTYPGFSGVSTVIANEFTGISTTDGAFQRGSSTSTTTVTTSLLNTTNPNDLILGIVSFRYPFTPANGFYATTFNGLSMVYKVVNVTGTFNTLGKVASGSWTAVMAGYK